MSTKLAFDSDECEGNRMVMCTLSICTGCVILASRKYVHIILSTKYVVSTTIYRAPWLHM